jgi:hypothetical protein
LPALAAQGANITINGFGDKDAIDTGANLSIDGGWTAE